MLKCLFFIGPSGSGKSTLLSHLSNVYSNIYLNQNNVFTINLDPAIIQEEQNDHQWHIDVRELIKVEEVMEQYCIGPNAAIMYSMGFIATNIEWLLDSITKLVMKHHSYLKYSHLNSSESTNTSHIILLFDLPGQIELYLSDDSIRTIVDCIVGLGVNDRTNSKATANHPTKLSLTASPMIVSLFDSCFLSSFQHFTSQCLVALSSFINMQLPCLSLLSKIDLLKGTTLPMGMLNDYLSLYSTEAMMDDLIEDSTNSGKGFLRALCQLIDQFGNVSFLPCSIRIPDLINHIIYEIQRITGTLDINAYHPRLRQILHEPMLPFSQERLITCLEAKLFSGEQQQEEQRQIQKEINRMLSDVAKDNSKTKDNTSQETNGHTRNNHNSRQ